jgi:hypothetical protein
MTLRLRQICLVAPTLEPAMGALVGDFCGGRYEMAPSRWIGVFE